MEIKTVKVGELKPHPKNPRVHPDSAIEKLERSIKEFGWTNPILVSAEGYLLAGHARLKAAEKAGISEVPVIYLPLEGAKAEAYLIADNRLQDETDWDYEKLKDLLQELDTGELDLELTGFDMGEIEDLMTQFHVPGEIIEDEVPEPPEEPITKPGDLWILGRHRLLCGDATKKEDVERLMDGKKADITFTSPPYNAAAKISDGDAFGPRKPKKMYAGVYEDNMSSEEYIEFAQCVLKMCFEFTNGFIFWNVGYNAKSKYEYIKQIEPYVENLIEQICWKKSSTIPLKGMMKREWEPVYVFTTTGKNLELDSVVSNHWEISNTNSQTGTHKACFPVELPQKGISLVKPITGVCFDPFGGSGSTLIACEQLNRTCHMMEIGPAYCDVIVKRWENFTGQKAVLAE